MKKRMIALLLCCVMLLTLSPNLIATAVADDDTVPTEQVEGQVEGQAEEKAEEKTPTAETTEEPKAEEPAAEPEEPASEEPKPEDPASEEPKDEEPAAKTEAELEAKTEEPVESEIVNPTVNYTDVAPFLPPVSGSTMLRAARAAANDTTGDAGEKDSGMKVSKTATDNGDGTYTITLEAYATGAQVITEIKEDVPTDIILVLDQSGSMAHCITCGQEIGRWSTHDTYVAVNTVDTSNTYYVKNGSRYTQVSYCDGEHSFMWDSWECEGGAGWYTSSYSDNHTAGNKITPKTSENPNGRQFYSYKSEDCTPRLSALKTAVNSFVNAVAEKAAGADGNIATTGDNIKHRIAVVGYADTDWNYGYNTGVFIGSTLNRYSNEAAKVYGTALQDMSTVEGKNNVVASLGALQASGATRTDYGLDMANSILNANPVPANEKRNRVVIVFTDGSPTDSNGFKLGVANDAIAKANTIKDSGTTVYSIGIFSGADATSAGTKPRDNLGQNSNQLSAASNWFMQNLSSNNGTVRSPSYYLSAGDAASLNSIFQQISSNITTGGSSTTLDEKTVIKDIISPQFNVPASAEKITVSTADSDGSTTAWKNKVPYAANVTIDQTMRTISVTNFSFKDNWCGNQTQNGTTTFHNGKKLIIEFTVSPRKGFLGGNNVFTNAGAGVYPNADAMEPVVSFPQPTVNVPIKDVNVTAENKNVYLLGSVTAKQLKDGATVKVGDKDGDGDGDVELKLDQPNYGLEDWQTEYVKITVDVQPTADSLTNLTDDTTYTIKVTVEPKDAAASTSSGDEATKQTGENTPAAKINVFKPVLTFKDSVAYYGDDAPVYSTTNKDGEVWKHGEIVSTKVTMLGTAPTLTITYTPAEGKIVAGKINTKQDIPVAVSVKIGETSVNDYTTFVHQACTSACGWNVTEPLNGNPAFLLHIKTCSLTITKEGGAENEPYVFTVKKDGKKYTEVTIIGNDSVTIYELPVGTYTIEEDTGWSWRYTPKYNTDGAALSAEKSTGTIICTNTPKNNQWLNGFSAVVTNIFGAKKH